MRILTSPSRRVRPMLVPVLAVIAAFCQVPRAHASHERPWVADTTQARIVQTIDLPGQAIWKQALPLKDGSVILLRETMAGDDSAYLLRLRPGTSSPMAFQPVWRDTDTTDSGPGSQPEATSFRPVALAADEADALWAVDQGLGSAYPRLIRLDPVSGAVMQVMPLPSGALSPNSTFTSLVVHGHMAYLADEGGIALVAFDLDRRTATRFFADYPTSRGHVPLTIDHHVVSGKDGHPLTRDIAYLALEADGAWLYELAPTGPIYRLSTGLLTDSAVTPSELMEGVTQWRGTPTIGGITIDDKATLYLTDISEGRLLSFDTGRHPHILLSAPLLVHAGMPGWSSARLDGSASGQLYIPVAHKLLRIALP